MKRRATLEDSSSQAGWMFADLFLALTVIFLATVSFIPSGQDSGTAIQNSVRNESSTNVPNYALTLISNGFIGDYSSNENSKFINDLNTYLDLKDLPNDTKALYLEVIGHTRLFGEPNDSGNLDALEFVIALRKEIPEVLAGTNTSINLSPEVQAGKVKVKITFA